MENVKASTLDTWPEVFYGERFHVDDMVLYEREVNWMPELFRVVDVVYEPSVLLEHDAFIHNERILRSEYNEKYQTIDGYHYADGRRVSMHIHRHLDDPIVALEEIPSAEDD